MKKKRIDVDDAPKGLTHNPFASLLPKPEGRETDATKRTANLASTARASTASDSTSQAAKVVVRREKKGRGGKTVTRVTGIDMPGQQLDELKREMTRALGCGGTIDVDDIVVQGDLTERAASWLGERLGVKVTIGN
ncbi:MAG: translation initiation factor 1 [Planctomycetota bacterium]|jgi:translation initiation factor 1